MLTKIRSVRDAQFLDDTVLPSERIVAMPRTRAQGLRQRLLQVLVGEHNLILLVLAMVASIVLAWPLSVQAHDPLIELLRDKGVLTSEEFERVQGRSSTIDERLIEVLRDKGILTDTEYRRLAHNPSPSHSQTPAAQARPARAEAETNAAAGHAPAREDGVIFKDAANGNRLALTAQAQADFRAYHSTITSAQSVNTFEIRRARFGVEGTFLKYYDVAMTGDFAAATRLDIAYINLGWWQPAQLRVGLFKMPFSLEEVTSDNYTDFQERSFANALVPAKERGAMLHGSPWKWAWYGLALSNGNGGVDRDDNDSKDAIGRVAVNLAETLDHHAMVLHLGAAGSSGSRPAGDIIPAVRTEGRGVTFFDTAALTGSRVHLERTGLEAALAWGPVKLQGESVSATFSGTSGAGVPYNRSMETYYASLSWLVTGEPYADAYSKGAFGRIRPTSNFVPEGGGWGGLELAVRYSQLDGQDFPLNAVAGTGALASGFITRANAWTVGAKWLLNANMRVLFNLVFTDFETPVTVGTTRASNERATLLRTQINF